MAVSRPSGLLRGQLPSSGREAAERPGWPAQQDRAAWLLRMNRLYGRDERWLRGRTFAAAFQGGCWPELTSEYRISRWETAAVRIPYLVVRRYEELLGLPTNALVALVDTIYRYASPGAFGLTLDRELPRSAPEPLPRVTELVELVRSTDAVPGSAWDELTTYLARAPHQLGPPDARWSDIAERLLVEMLIADGVSWMQRHEAMNRLLAHPAGQRAAIAACTSMVADPQSQVFVEVVSVLDASAHPDASRYVLDQLTNPTNDRARYGALLACIRKLRFGHFTPPQVRRLVPIVAELAGAGTHYQDGRQLAAELLRRLPTDVPTTMRTRLKDLAVDPTLNPSRAAGPNAATGTEGVMIRRIGDAVLARMPRDLSNFTDRLLPVLLAELLFSPVFDVRLYAAMLLAATPYREPLAATLSGELARQATSRTVDVANAMVEALRIVGDAEQRPLIERLTTANGVPASITVAATQAIGHVGGHSDDRYWRGAIRHHARLWHQTGSPTHASALNGLVYGLGMARSTGILELLRDDRMGHPLPRSAAAWWLNLPKHLYEGAGC